MKVVPVVAPQILVVQVSRTALTVMNGLHATKLSKIARKRKRKVHMNPPPPRGKQSSCSRGRYPKSVTPAQRVKEHPSEELMVSNSTLFCNACRKELSLKANIVRNHIKSAKHENGNKKLKSKEAREKEISVALQLHNEKAHEGESLQIDQNIIIGGKGW